MLCHFFLLSVSLSEGPFYSWWEDSHLASGPASFFWKHSDYIVCERKVTRVSASRAQLWISFSLEFHKKPQEFHELQRIWDFISVPTAFCRPLFLSIARDRMDSWLDSVVAVLLLRCAWQHYVWVWRNITETEMSAQGHRCDLCQAGCATLGLSFQISSDVKCRKDEALCQCSEIDWHSSLGTSAFKKRKFLSVWYNEIFLA